MSVPGNVKQAVVEIRKTKDTASRLANGEYPEDADHIRVLAGMIQQLAEQVERLAGVGPLANLPKAAGVAQVRSKEAEAAVEEDQSPGKAPAEPINERT
jgi:hypothetical protein